MAKEIQLAFDMNCVVRQPPGIRRQPRDRSDKYTSLDYWIELGAIAVYTLVSIVVTAGAVMMLPRMFQAANKIISLDPAAGQFMMSLLLPAVVIPGLRYLRPWIERFFFAERYALERGVEH